MDIKDRIQELLKVEGFSLDDDSLDFVIERFGVKSVEEVDSDFIQIILSMIPQEQREDTGKEYITQHSENVSSPIPTVSERVQTIEKIISERAEAEAAKISNLHKNLPIKVKELVLKDLQEEMQACKENPENLFQLKHTVEFSVLANMDRISSRNLVFSVFLGLWLLFILLTIGILGNVRDKDETTTNTTVQIEATK